jgi:hypothetical protein
MERRGYASVQCGRDSGALAVGAPLPCRSYLSDLEADDEHEIEYYAGCVTIKIPTTIRRISR